LENSGGNLRRRNWERNHPYWTKVQYTRVAFSVYLYTTNSVDTPTFVEA
jgi:hypothetical protein